MGKRKIDTMDSVEFSNDWDFVKQKKQRIKIKSERAVNSEFYMTFTNLNALYTFLYFALAPEEAFGFQKVQPILDKMRGESEQERNNFERLRKELSLNWDNHSPLSEVVRRIRQNINREQKALYDVSSRIDQQEAKQLLRSGLSQRKIHLDYHTNDGQTEQQIIPTIENIMNCVTIIYEQKNSKYLLAFLTHIEEQRPEQQSTQASETKNNQTQNIQTFADRPINTDSQNPDNRQLPKHHEQQNERDRQVPRNHQQQNERYHPRQILNPDERPLPQPEGIHRVAGPHSIPSHPRNIVDPDERPLNPPQRVYRVDGQQHRQIEPVKPVPTAPRHILDPDEKLLPPPPKEQRPRRPSENNRSNNDLNKSKASTSNKNQKQNEVHQENSTFQELKEDIIHIGEVANEKAHTLGEKVVDFGRKAEEKIEQVVDEIRHDGRPWFQWAIAGGIALAAVSILRAR